MSRARLKMIIALAVGAAVGLGGLPAGAAAFSTTDKAKILYVGDSLAVNTGNVVQWWTQVSGKATTQVNAFPGMALCDFLDGKPAGMAASEKLPARVRSFKPNLVILQFWGNRGTPCISGLTDAQYQNQYFWDALNAVNQIRDAAASVGIPKPRILWALQGPDRGSATRTRDLNASYDYAAGTAGDRTSDAGRTVSLAANYWNPGSRYGWTQWLPCTDFERQTNTCTNPQAYGGVAQIHRDDDSVHFCLNAPVWIDFTCKVSSPGASRYGMQIASDANRWLGI